LYPGYYCYTSFIHFILLSLTYFIHLSHWCFATFFLTRQQVSCKKLCRCVITSCVNVSFYSRSLTESYVNSQTVNCVWVHYRHFQTHKYCLMFFITTLGVFVVNTRLRESNHSRVSNISKHSQLDKTGPIPTPCSASYRRVGHL